MKKLVLNIGVDTGSKEGTGFHLLKDGKIITLSVDEAEGLCKDLAKSLDFEVIEKNRLKIFGPDGMKPNGEYIGSLLGKYEDLNEGS